MVFDAQIKFTFSLRIPKRAKTFARELASVASRGLQWPPTTTTPPLTTANQQ